jgi:hypothetical protein
MNPAEIDNSGIRDKNGAKGSCGIFALIACPKRLKALVVRI